MMKIARKIAVNIGRLLLAATFIFSGFVKGIDPLGTQYKITDYLEALHIDWIRIFFIRFQRRQTSCLWNVM